jgi:hypothetical protein
VIISRRQALARMLALTGSVMVGAEFFLTSSARADKRTTASFTPEELALMDEMGETILPATDIPGAKAVGISAFMASVVNDCYDDATAAIFRAGLGQLDEASRTRNGKSFLVSAPADRTALLNELAREERVHSAANPGTSSPHYFHLFKQLTLLGYFTSEVGCTRALRYVAIPGAYHGDVPYRKGDKAWANPLT